MHAPLPACTLEFAGVAGGWPHNGRPLSPELRTVIAATALAYELAGFDHALLDTPADPGLMAQAAGRTARIGLMAKHDGLDVPPGLPAAISGTSHGDRRPLGLYLTRANRSVCAARAAEAAGPALPVYREVHRPDAALAAVDGCDVLVFAGGRTGEIARVIDTLRTRTAHRQHAVRFGAVVRVVAGETQDAAWARAFWAYRRGHVCAAPASEQGRYLLTAAEQNGVMLTPRLYATAVRQSGTAGLLPTLIGAPEQIALRLLPYLDAGITTLFVRGFAPLEDAPLFGSLVMPLLRAELARRAGLPHLAGGTPADRTR